MWPRQSRKNSREASTSPERHPALKKIGYTYSGSPDSPCKRRSISRLLDSDDIKRNLRNITDDDDDHGYSTPVVQCNFSLVNSPSVTRTVVTSSPCNSIDSGFQSPTGGGLQSTPNGTLSFNLTPQLNFSSSPVFIGIKEEEKRPKENDAEFQSGAVPKDKLAYTFLVSDPKSNRVRSGEEKTSPLCSQFRFSTPVQENKNRQSLESNSLEKPESLKTIYVNTIDFSSPSTAVLDPASLQTAPYLHKGSSETKDIVIEIIKSQECQTTESSKSKTVNSCLEKPNNDKMVYKRPTQSYEKLIIAALNSHPDKKMTLKEIRQWIEDTYLFYKNSPNPGWKDAIRHNLSVNKLFVKESPKYGSCWKLVSKPKESLTSSQLPSALKSKCQTISSPRISVPPIKDLNLIKKFPVKNSKEKQRPLPILPRPSVDPQTYVLVPLQYFYDSAQKNVPIVPQLNQKDKGSSTFVPASNVVIARSSSSPVPITSTPILSTSSSSSSSSNMTLTRKDLLNYLHNPALSPVAVGQTKSPCRQSFSPTLILPAKTPNAHPSISIRTPNPSNDSQKWTSAKSSEIKSKIHSSLSLEHNTMKEKLPSDRKSRRKQRLVYKDMSPVAPSHCDAEVSGQENVQISSPLPVTPKSTSPLSSVKTPSPTGRNLQVLSSNQILLASPANNSFYLQGPMSLENLLSDELLPNSLEEESPLKDGTLFDSVDSIDKLWELWS